MTVFVCVCVCVHGQVQAPMCFFDILFDHNDYVPLK